MLIVETVRREGKSVFFYFLLFWKRRSKIYTSIYFGAQNVLA